MYIILGHCQIYEVVTLVSLSKLRDNSFEVTVKELINLPRTKEMYTSDFCYQSQIELEDYSICWEY